MNTTKFNMKVGKTVKRFIALCISLVLLLSAITISTTVVYADTPNEVADTNEGGTPAETDYTIIAGTTNEAASIRMG